MRDTSDPPRATVFHFDTTEKEDFSFFSFTKCKRFFIFFFFFMCMYVLDRIANCEDEKLLIFCFSHVTTMTMKNYGYFHPFGKGVWCDL